MCQLAVCSCPLAVSRGIGCLKVGPDVALLLFCSVVLTAAGVVGSRSCVLRCWVRKLLLVCMCGTWLGEL